MSADAMARLREDLSFTEFGSEYATLRIDRVRAVLDRLEVLETAFAAAKPSLEAEALDALERLHDAAENGSVRGADRAAAEAILAKAGRR